MFRTVRWRIAIPYVILTLLVLVGLLLWVSSLLRGFYQEDLRAQLRAEAQLLSETLAPMLGPGAAGQDLDEVARQAANALEARVTVIGLDGTVLGESHEDRASMDNHLLRTEVQQALAGGEGFAIRFSRTVGYDMMYVAVAVRAGEQTVGVARVALPMQAIGARLAGVHRTILAVALVTALLAILLAVWLAERLVQPLRQLTSLAGRLAGGDLSARLFLARRDEVGQLAGAFNAMANELQGKVGTLSREQSRLSAVLDHMADGVLITDGEGQIQLLDPAAARLLRTGEREALGRSFTQVARHHQIVEAWQSCRAEGKEIVEVVEAQRQGPFLRVVATPLPETTPPGCLVILQDLTAVRRLETVRRDFISNISHELRTPLASLKALVDTLRDAALDDPPAARRFLDRVEVEVDALTQIVQELLELSRIESGQVPLRSRAVAVGDVIAPPVERLQAQAQRAGLAVSVDLPADLPPILADPERIQQVVTNLVHNAIKFTPAGGSATISARREGNEVIVAVRDTGVGISADDLPRIFERFYKADRARSGGGTGLGLAIAKHIVQAHGGRIWAESVERRGGSSPSGGSTFYFSLPLAQ